MLPPEHFPQTTLKPTALVTLLVEPTEVTRQTLAHIQNTYLNYEDVYTSLKLQI